MSRPVLRKQDAISRRVTPDCLHRGTEPQCRRGVLSRSEASHVVSIYAFVRLNLIGTPESIARDFMESFEQDAADGFVLKGTNAFCTVANEVFPILRERGILRRLPARDGRSRRRCTAGRLRSYASVGIDLRRSVCLFAIAKIKNIIARLTTCSKNVI